MTRTLAALPLALLLLGVAPLQAAPPTAQTVHTPRATRPPTLAWSRTLGARLLEVLPRFLRYPLLRSQADLVVVSDLHLGEGSDPLEDFKADDAFGQMIDHLARRQRRASRPLKLVLAGDTLDCAAINPAQPPGAGDVDARPTEAIAVDKLRRAARGHPKVFGALRRLVSEGHEIVVIPGNHDLELGFPGVERELRRLLGADGRRAARLQVRPWFEQHGCVLVEHGQRYEPVTNLGWMLAPFEHEAGEQRLRGSAASYLVCEMLNPLKATLPELSYLSSGRNMFLEVARRRPGAVTDLVRFADALARRMGRGAAEEQALAAVHDQELRKLVASLRGTINASRRKLGMAALSEEKLLGLLRRFDELAAQPHLSNPAPRGGFVRRVVQMLRPSELDKWFNPAERGTLREGQAFALSHLASVLVGGHTHSASHYVLRRGGERLNHLLNAGTWIPVTVDGGRIERTGLLTFVEVRQIGGQTTARLRRWDVGSSRPVTIAPTPLAEGELLSESPSH